MMSFNSRISLLIFCLDDLSIGNRKVLNYLTTTVLGSICGMKSFSVCLMKLGVLTLDAYRLMIISFWCIVPFISMKCLIWPSKFEVYFVWYKYCYSCLFSGAISLVNLLPIFHLKPVFISVNKLGSCKQQIVRSFFLVQFAKWCLLMGEFSPLTFTVSIDRYMVIPAI
jgi:hypothetical protein